MSLGYTPREIDELDMDEADELFRYLNKHPPTHELAAIWMGLKPKEETVDLPRDDPSVMIGINVMAGIEKGKAENNVASNGEAFSGLQPGGAVRI